ncbi:MAG: VanZ family protein [Burkholderiaceae bacterium]|nr:VanZ family protein [Burkholderiaceae bacterium]MDP1968591.1 VanZ family protein [Burkholderiaceae bacterium]
MHKTSAWPLALIYAALILYASLYPFADWRNQGIAPWAFLASPLPKYWTGFDVAANIVGYAPLGFLLALSAQHGRPTGRGPPAVTLATLAAGLLSLLMEAAQSYLPSRVASNMDFALNLLGTWLGASAAWLLVRIGTIDRWSRIRQRWFVEDARGALVLLALWPVALLFPASVPLGLGQVFERVEASLADALQHSPFLDWLPVRDIELQPLVPGAALLGVMLGALVPCLLGYCVIRNTPQRIAFALLALATGVVVTALSAALSYGPAHAWAWLSPPVRAGLGAALVLAVLLLPLPRRGAAAMLLLALAVQLSLLNQASSSVYFAQTLQTWEQGRFIRFHGLAQWLGWFWPYAALVYVLVRVSRQEAKN